MSKVLLKEYEYPTIERVVIGDGLIKSYRFDRTLWGVKVIYWGHDDTVIRRIPFEIKYLNNPIHRGESIHVLIFTPNGENAEQNAIEIVYGRQVLGPIELCIRRDNYVLDTIEAFQSDSDNITDDEMAFQRTQVYLGSKKTRVGDYLGFPIVTTNPHKPVKKKFWKFR